MAAKSSIQVRADEQHAEDMQSRARLVTDVFGITIPCDECGTALHDGESVPVGFDSYCVPCAARRGGL